jgi:SAM-dependent methyltransferase
MGINAEFVLLLLELRRRGELRGDRVIELGAQDVSASPNVVARLLERGGLGPERAPFAADLYARFGLSHYASVDTSGYLNSIPLDLNRDLELQGLTETYDLVTNAGTLEHCFDQMAAFRNMHNLCRPGGMMLHVMPSQGQVNHAFFNYHPRFVWELSHANSYDVLAFYFTIDFRPVLIRYTADAFRSHEDRDVMLYVALRKVRDQAFLTPTDRIFEDASAVQNSEFRSWIKTTWDNVQGFEALE